MNTKHIVSLSLWAAVLGCALLVGCGEKLPDGMPKLSPCTLKMEYTDGTPATEVLIALVPVDPTNRWAASGETNSSGVVTFLTMGLYNGVVPGEYKVTATKTEWKVTGQKSEDGTELTASTQLIADKYVAANTTPLKLSVKTSKTSETLQMEKR